MYLVRMISNCRGAGAFVVCPVFYLRTLSSLKVNASRPYWIAAVWVLPVHAFVFLWPTLCLLAFDYAGLRCIPRVDAAHSISC